MTDEDLVVLLSERAAREIHKKWCDTLEVCICMLMLWHIMSCSMCALLQCKRNEFQFHLQKQLQEGEVVTFNL